jgi:hypothetical protein
VNKDRGVTRINDSLEDPMESIIWTVDLYWLSLFEVFIGVLDEDM